MQTNEKIPMRLELDEKVIKNLLTSDTDFARRWNSIRRSKKVKEAYAKAEKEVKQKAAEATEVDENNVKLMWLDKTFTEGIYHAFTMSVLGTAINKAVETDLQKPLKKYMLEIMDEDFMLEIIEKLTQGCIDAIEDFMLQVKATKCFEGLFGDIYGDIEEE